MRTWGEFTLSEAKIASLYPASTVGPSVPPPRARPGAGPAGLGGTASTHQARCLATRHLPAATSACLRGGAGGGGADLGPQECGGGGEIPSLSLALLQLPAAFSLGLNSASQHRVRIVRIEDPGPPPEGGGRPVDQANLCGLAFSQLSYPVPLPVPPSSHSQPAPHCGGAPPGTFLCSSLGPSGSQCWSPVPSSTFLAQMGKPRLQAAT